MGKCSICGKYFPDDVSAIEFMKHINEFHNEEIEKTKEEIKAHKWDKEINKEENMEESRKIVKALLGLKGMKKLKELEERKVNKDGQSNDNISNLKGGE